MHSAVGTTTREGARQGAHQTRVGANTGWESHFTNRRNTQYTEAAERFRQLAQQQQGQFPRHHSSHHRRVMEEPPFAVSSFPVTITSRCPKSTKPRLFQLLHSDGIATNAMI